MPANVWPSILRAPREADFILHHEVRRVISPSDGSAQSFPLWAKWRAYLTFPVRTLRQALALEAALDALTGSSQAIMVPNYKYRTLGGTATGSITILSNPPARSTTISVGGMGAGTTFLAGDMIELRGGLVDVPRLHRILADTAANVNGNASLGIAPPLRREQTAGNAVRYLGSQSILSCTMILKGEVGAAPAFPTAPGRKLVRERTLEFEEELAVGLL